MGRPSDFEPPVSKATRVEAGTIVVPLGSKRINALLDLMKRTVEKPRSPGQIVVDIVDEKLASAEKVRKLAAMFIPEDHAG